MEKRSIVIIGAGPAGLAAAIAAKENGVEDVLILERDDDTGGILRQCIHTGFGLHMLGEDLTGPEYAQHFSRTADELKIEYRINTMVLNITKDRVITAVNSKEGTFQIQADAIVLAMGCRERTRGAIGINGTRPAGVLTAGTAQRFVNIEGYMPGKKVVILGSGDIGLIMARRMTLEGAKVEMVLEVMPYSGGLQRNIVQCLDDFDIPLKLSHTVISIKGKERLESVVIAQVDEKMKPIPGTEQEVECDTLLLSVGLIPENELSLQAQVSLNKITNGPVVTQGMQTSVDGIFACGNVVHVHDLVDFVTMESQIAGRAAADYVLNKASSEGNKIDIQCGNSVRYIVPNNITKEKLYFDEKFMLRVDNVYNDVVLQVLCGENIIYKKKMLNAAPGEMIAIPITKELVNSIEGDLVRIEIVKQKKMVS